MPTMVITPMEKIVRERQKKRKIEEAKKSAQLTHKDKVAIYNQSLERLSEHHDIPKVGPG